MVWPFVKVMLSYGHDSVRRLWLQCHDVERTAALMCYLQMALWNLPGVVIVGNMLAIDAREVFYTLANRLGGWHWRLKRRDQAEEAGEVDVADESLTE